MLFFNSNHTYFSIIERFFILLHTLRFWGVFFNEIDPIVIVIQNDRLSREDGACDKKWKLCARMSQNIKFLHLKKSKKWLKQFPASRPEVRFRTILRSIKAKFIAPQADLFRFIDNSPQTTSSRGYLNTTDGLGGKIT